ncbi:hypothetical protein Q5752_002109 [Cryptotrichosporon argae]
MSKPRVNLRSTAVKRIMQEAAELSKPDEDDFVAGPLESDIFEWHCTVRGVKGSEYDGGIYHLRIVLPASYPMSAPDIILLTPNGRFELGKKICIDGLTSFHAGSWQPAWGVRTAITGLRSFWMQGGEAMSAIGALDVPRAERVRLAKLSRQWTCPTCGVPNEHLLPDAPATTPALISTPAQASSSTATDTSLPTEPPVASVIDVSDDTAPSNDATLLPGVSLAAPLRSGAVVPDLPTAMPAPQIDRPTSPQLCEPRPAVAPSPDVLAPAHAAPQPDLVRAEYALHPRPQVPTPARAVAAPPAPRARPPHPPIWLDALIALCVAALLGLLVRRA